MFGLVLGVRTWDYEKEGRRRQGASIQVVLADRGGADDSRRGLDVVEERLPLDLVSQLRDLPGVYELRYELGRSFNGRGVEHHLVGLRPLGPVPVAELIADTVRKESPK